MINVNELKFDEKGLIPAVVVDAKSKKVLTVAYMNKESGCGMVEVRKGFCRAKYISHHYVLYKLYAINYR